MSAHCTNNSQLVQQGVCGVAVFFVAQGSRFPGGLGQRRIHRGGWGGPDPPVFEQRGSGGGPDFCTEAVVCIFTVSVH